MEFIYRILAGWCSRLGLSAALRPLAVALAVALAPGAAAQPPQAPASEEVKSSPSTNGAVVDIYRGQGAQAIPDDVIDEIIVVAPRTRFMIEEDIRRADIEMYRIFNALNDEKQFDVYCDWENPRVGTHRKRHVCRPAFEQGVSILAFGGPEVPNTATTINRSAGEIARDRRKLEEKMLALAEKNPELTRAIIERAALEREKRRSGRRNTE